jgi:hypothetical protein
VDLPVNTPIRVALNADSVQTFRTLRGGLPVPLIAAAAGIRQGTEMVQVTLEGGGIETDGHELTVTWPKESLVDLVVGPADYDVVGRLTGGAVVTLACGTVAVVAGAAELEEP